MYPPCVNVYCWAGCGTAGLVVGRERKGPDVILLEARLEGNGRHLGKRAFGVMDIS